MFFLVYCSKNQIIAGVELSTKFSDLACGEGSLTSTLSGELFHSPCMFLGQNWSGPTLAIYMGPFGSVGYFPRI